MLENTTLNYFLQFSSSMLFSIFLKIHHFKWFSQPLGIYLLAMRNNKCHSCLSSQLHQMEYLRGSEPSCNFSSMLRFKDNSHDKFLPPHTY